MSIIKRKRQTNELETEIKSVLKKMAQLSPDSKEYTAMVSNLKTLYEAQSKEKDRGVSLDTLLVVGVSLVEVLAMLHYEKLGVITSKVTGFIIKGRV
jgi:hypothetical protein